MKKMFQLFSCALVCAALLFVTGCTSTRQIEEGKAIMAELDEEYKNNLLNEKVETDSGTVDTADSETADPK